MSAPHSAIVGYLRDCYQADRRGTTLWNIFDRKTEHRIVLSGEENLANGFLPYIPVDAKRGLAAAGAARLYDKEKDLVYGSFFVVGAIAGADAGMQTLCSPLLMFPATVRDEDGQALLSVDLSDRRLNTLLIEALCPDGEQSASVYEDLLHAVPEEIHDFGAVSTLVGILAAYIPGLDVDAAFRFPRLESESALRRAIRSAGDGTGSPLCLVSAGAVASRC